MDNALFYFGDTLKALDDKGRIGGYAVRFTDPKHRDLYGEYFTKYTYFGAHQGDGVDVLFHHGQRLYTTRRMTEEQKQALESFRDHIFSPAKTKKDEVGLFTEVVLDMADQYEQAVFGLVKAGKLGWSSASASHTVKRTDDGEITRWPIIEISMTPTPAEPLNRAVTLKAFESLKFVPLDDHADETNQKAISDAEQQVSSFGALDMETHFLLTVSAIRGITSRFHQYRETRLKAGRELSEKNCQRLNSVLDHGRAALAEGQSLLDESAGTMNDAEKRASLTQQFMTKYRYDRQ